MLERAISRWAARWRRSCSTAPTDIPELVELCRRAFEEWIGLFQEVVCKAGIPDKRARSLALLVEVSIEGLMVIARATRDSSVLLGVADELAALVEAAAGKDRLTSKKQKGRHRCRPSLNVRMAGPSGQARGRT